MPLFSRSLILVASLLLAVAGDAAEPVIIKFCEVVDQVSEDVVSVAGPPRSKEHLLIRKEPAMDSRHLKEATVAQTAGAAEQQWSLKLTFTEAGSKRFAELTTRLIGNRLAILANDKVLIAPTIRSSITGGNAEISGAFTEKEIKNLADAIMRGIQSANGAAG